MAASHPASKTVGLNFQNVYYPLKYGSFLTLDYIAIRL